MCQHILELLQLAFHSDGRVSHSQVIERKAEYGKWQPSTDLGYPGQFGSRFTTVHRMTAKAALRWPCEAVSTTFCSNTSKEASRNRMVSRHRSKEDLDYHFWGDSIAVSSSPTFSGLKWSQRPRRMAAYLYRRGMRGDAGNDYFARGKCKGCGDSRRQKPILI